MGLFSSEDPTIVARVCHMSHIDTVPACDNRTVGFTVAVLTRCKNH